jgi:signal transduction histidine kinase
MGLAGRFVTSVSGARIVVALGVLYVVASAVRAYLVVTAGARLPGQLLNFLLVAVPSLVLAYCGYRLPASDIPRDAYLRIAVWSVVGGGAMILVILVVEFTPGSGIENLRLAVLLFGVLGTLCGFGIGRQEARTVTQAREADRRRREVERYSDELERQNDRLESFAGMLAHELRNPLNIAQIYVQQVDDDTDATDEIVAALDRIEEMIDVLLLTVRGSDVDVDLKPVTLSAVAREVWADLSPEDDRLVVETEQIVKVDPVHVRHLLENLFRNAVEHGGASVTVRVGALEGADGFYVEDDGPGIPEDIRDDVVEAGYTTKSDGIGLGLTFVVNLVETYGWKLSITNSPAGGARFEFSGVDTLTPEPEQR